MGIKVDVPNCGVTGQMSTFASTILLDPSENHFA
jgi:hypothetical protein